MPNLLSEKVGTHNARGVRRCFAALGVLGVLKRYPKREATVLPGDRREGCTIRAGLFSCVRLLISTPRHPKKKSPVNRRASLKRAVDKKSNSGVAALPTCTTR